MISLELLTIFTTASLRKFFSSAAFGVPVTFLQQGDEKDCPRQDEVQVLTSFQYPPRGAKGEVYAIVNVQLVVKTKIVPTDIYYHTRVKSRVIAIMDQIIPLFKIGGDDTLIYDKSQWGILRRIPSDTIKITPTSIDVPDASLVEAYYEIQTC